MAPKHETLMPLHDYSYVFGAVESYASDYVNQALILEEEDNLTPAENGVRKRIIPFTVPVAAELISLSEEGVIDKALAYDRELWRFTASERDEIGSYYDSYARAKKDFEEKGKPIERAEREAVKYLRVLMAPRAVRDELFSGKKLKRKHITPPRLKIACEFVADVVYRLADGNYTQKPD